MLIVQTYLGHVHGCDVVPPLLHALCNGRLPPPGMFVRSCLSHLLKLLQDVAASCIFLATKTEECGRKLRDVARLYQAKVNNVDITTIPADSKVGLYTLLLLVVLIPFQDVDNCQVAILLTEEVLLEALCFDFVVDSPHAELLDLFETLDSSLEIQEYAWSLAHDS